MYLSPDLGARVPLPQTVGDELTGVLAKIEQDDDITSASPDIARRFPAPDRPEDVRELTFTGAVQGRGLFGGSDVWVTKTAAQTAEQLLRGADAPPPWSPPVVTCTRRAAVVLDRRIDYALRTEPGKGHE